MTTIAKLQIQVINAEPIGNPQAIKVSTAEFEALQMQDTFQCQNNPIGNAGQLGICQKYCFPP